MTKKPVNISLDKVKDADIIAYLETGPTTYLIKRALRAHMDAEKRINEALVIAPTRFASQPLSNDIDDEIPF